jgi:hypothetical protein
LRALELISLVLSIIGIQRRLVLRASLSDTLALWLAQSTATQTCAQPGGKHGAASNHTPGRRPLLSEPVWIANTSQRVNRQPHGIGKGEAAGNDGVSAEFSFN